MMEIVEKRHVMLAEALLRAGSDTSSVMSIPGLIVGLFVSHLEEQQSKMLAHAGRLNWRLGAESVVSRLDDDLLEIISSRSSSSLDALSIGEQVEQRSVVPPMEEEKVDSGDSGVPGDRGIT